MIDEPERALEFESEFLEVEHPWIQQFTFARAAAGFSRIFHFFCLGGMWSCGGGVGKKRREGREILLRGGGLFRNDVVCRK